MFRLMEVSTPETEGKLMHHALWPFFGVNQPQKYYNESLSNDQP